MGGRADVPVIFCTTGGHQKVPAVGEGQLDMFAPRLPYCRGCLLRCVSPVTWWAVTPTPATQVTVGGVVLDGTALMTAITERLFWADSQLRQLHHTYPRLDANARHLIAELAVDALFEVLAER